MKKKKQVKKKELREGFSERIMDLEMEIEDELDMDKFNELMLLYTVYHQSNHRKESSTTMPEEIGSTKYSKLK